VSNRTWRTRLASLIAALGASVALTTGSSTLAEASTPQLTPPSVEIRSANRLAKLVFHRTAQGGLRIAGGGHASHESHASHASHSSHVSGYMR
jgi:hypothetical protein